MTTSDRTPTRGEWLALEQASDWLGVHSTTLRRWVDEGAIDAFFTPGGHRRFRLADLERFERERHRTRILEVLQQEWVDHAIAHTRQEIASQHWAAPYGETEREAQRTLGRRLMELTLQYLARKDDADELLAEARVLGSHHASYGLRRGQSLVNLLQAVSFFRTTILEVALIEHPRTAKVHPEASTRLLRRIERLLSEVEAGVVEMYLERGATS